MGTIIRPELSQKNQYWIDRHRYYELKHFCLQYPTWRKNYASLDSMSNSPTNTSLSSKTNVHGNPTAKCAESKLFYLDRIKLIEQTAENTDQIMERYILKGVTEGLSYDILKARLEIPCGKDKYYDLYRKFFWLLDKERQ